MKNVNPYQMCDLLTKPLEPMIRLVEKRPWMLPVLFLLTTLVPGLCIGAFVKWKRDADRKEWRMQDVIEEANKAIKKKPTAHNYLCRAERRWDAGQVKGCMEDIWQASRKAKSEKDWGRIRGCLYLLKFREPSSGSTIGKVYHVIER